MKMEMMEYLDFKEQFYEQDNKLTPQQALYLWENWIFDYDEVGGDSMLQEMIKVAFESLKREVKGK